MEPRNTDNQINSINNILQDFFQEVGLFLSTHPNNTLKTLERNFWNITKQLLSPTSTNSFFSKKT